MLDHQPSFPLDDDLVHCNAHDLTSSCALDSWSAMSQPDISSSWQTSLPPDVFIADEWLGRGKVWDDSIPVPVQNARDVARHIPLWIRDAYLPPPATIVPTMLEKSMLFSTDSPTRPSSIRGYFTQGPSYSDDEPNVLQTATEDRIDVIQAVVPHYSSQSALDLLRRGFNNAWLSCKLSISLPRATPL